MTTNQRGLTEYPKLKTIMPGILNVYSGTSEGEINSIRTYIEGWRNTEKRAKSSAGRVEAKRRIEAKRVAHIAARSISIRFATQSALAPPTFDTPVLFDKSSKFVVTFYLATARTPPGCQCHVLPAWSWESSGAPVPSERPGPSCGTRAGRATQRWGSTGSG